MRSLRDLIRHQVASSIFRVTVTRQPTPGATPLAAPVMARVGGIATAGQRSAGASGGASASASGRRSRPERVPRRAGPLPQSRRLAPDPDGPGEMRWSTNRRARRGARRRPRRRETGLHLVGRPQWAETTRANSRGSGLKYKKCHGR